MNKLIDYENTLVDKIKKMPERKKIKEIEDQIFQNEKSLSLIKNFQNAQEDYSFCLRVLKNDQKLIKEKQDLLYKAKLEMDNDKLIKQYNDLLKTINEPLYYLEFKLISLFQKRGHHQC